MDLNTVEIWFPKFCSIYNLIQCKYLNIHYYSQSVTLDSGNFLINKIGSSHKNLNEVIEVKVEITERLVNSAKNFALHSGGNAS